MRSNFEGFALQNLLKLPRLVAVAGAQTQCLGLFFFFFGTCGDRLYLDILYMNIYIYMYII